MLEQEVLAYLSSHMEVLFPEYRVAGERVSLPGAGQIDIHARDTKGHDLFLAFKPELKKRDLGWIVDFYSAATNITPMKPKVVFVGFRADLDAQQVLKQLDAGFIRLSTLPIREGLLQAWWKRFKSSRARLLPPEESRIVSYLQSQRTTAVTVRDVATRFKLSQNHASQLVGRLRKKGWLSKIERGKFLFIPAEYGYDERFPPMHPLLAGSVLVRPYYYSYATANAHYGLTTQARSTVFLATTRRRPPVVWQGHRFRFVHMKPGRFFGYVRATVDDSEIHVASLEKAVVDSILRSELAGGLPEVVLVLANAIEKVDQERLVDYAIRMRSRSVIQRLGFLSDFLVESGMRGLRAASRARLLTAVGETPVRLASVARYGTGGSLNKPWKLYSNFPLEELKSDLRLR